jgi:hypothetical protein
MFRNYQRQIEEVLGAKSPVNWTEKLEKHIEMISIIQHERLIHLLVTVFVGSVMSMSFLVTIVTEKTYLLFLDLPLLILFTGYIFHYRFLENTTQKWYLYSDVIRKKIKK